MQYAASFMQNLVLDQVDFGIVHCLYSVVT